jgi:NDP-sugar pyrophosphorylase family protein
MSSRPQVVIPMSGKGSRFIRAGYAELKPFIQVNGKPIIEHIIGQFPEGYDFLAILSSDNPHLEVHIEQLENISDRVQIAIIKPHKLGPGHAIREASEFISSNVPIVVSYCDFTGDWDPNAFLEKLEDFDCNILTYSGFHPHMNRTTKFAYAKMGNDLVVEVREKESFTNTPKNEEASAGIYGFKNKEILMNAIDQQIKEKLEVNGELYISLTCQAIIQNSGKVTVTRMQKFFQWGTPEDLEDWIYWDRFFKKFKEQRHYSSSLANARGSVLILAGGKGSRLSHMVLAPKPFLQVNGKSLWEHSLLCSQATLVIREDLAQTVKSNRKVNAVEVPNFNGGQAESALVGLNSIQFGGPVSIMASDNIVLDVDVAKLHSNLDAGTVYVWVCKNYPAALHNPTQYSWISVSENGDFLDFYPKSKPDDELNCMNLIGNFTFPSKEIAITLISEIQSRGLRINGEFYLDSILSITKELNLRVKVIETKEYFSIGTEAELETFLYWDSEAIPQEELQSNE